MQIIHVDVEPGVGSRTANVVTATKAADEWHFLATVGRGTPPEDIERFVLWADEVSRRLVDYGPAVDGWEPRSDGRWVWSERSRQHSAG